MQQFKTELNGNEKLARMVTGPDTEATHVTVDDKLSEEMLNIEKVSKFNQEVGDLQEKFQKHVEDIQDVGKQISADMENIEIMPLSSYALITPFKTNPFQKIQTKGNIITDLGGLAPTYKSNETGEIEEEQQYVKVGVVMETGTECKFLQPGDIVFYNIASEVQVPFYKFGFVIVAEQRIIAVVNEKLSQRKSDIVTFNKTDK